MLNSSSPYSLSSLLSFLNRNFVVLLALTLIFVGGFLGGSLWTENKLLKQNGGIAQANQPTTNPPTDTGPTKEQLAQVQDINNDDYQQGAGNPQITLIEYSDLECPFCQSFHPTMKQVMAEYGDKVAWVFRHYPLPFHSFAQKAAEAAECVGKSGGEDAFWKFTDLYYERTKADGQGFPQDQLAALGAEAGANKDAVQTCIDSGEMAQKIQDQMSAGSAAGISGTPGTIVVTADGAQELIPGALPFDQVKTTIEKYL